MWCVASAAPYADGPSTGARAFWLSAYWLAILDFAFIPSAGIWAGQLAGWKVPMPDPIGKRYAISERRRVREIGVAQAFRMGDFSGLRPGAPFLGVLPDQFIGFLLIGLLRAWGPSS